jgi:hypothetical protein
LVKHARDQSSFDSQFIFLLPPPYQKEKNCVLILQKNVASGQ